MDILKITRARKVILMCCDDNLDDSDYFPINMKNLSLVAEKLTTPSYGFLLDQLVLNHPNRELPNMFMNLIKGKVCIKKIYFLSIQRIYTEAWLKFFLELFIRT